MTTSMPPVPPSPPLRLLCVGEAAQRRRAALSASAWGPFELEACDDLDAASRLLAEGPRDALLGPLPAAHWAGLGSAALDTALVLLHADGAPPTVAQAADWLGRGVQDLLPAGSDAESLARALRLAVERKRLEQAARKAAATDLASGLPNHMQLVELMSQLMALRQRQPAPMALVVLRIEGLQTAEARLGRESALALRRKIAVRLRASVRASDVVASLAGDAFAVLLSALEDPSHAERVAQKLLAALRQPLRIAGEPVAVAASAGIAQYPQDGDQPDALLRRASGSAAALPAQGRAGFVNRLERGGAMPQAANDDEPPA